MDQMPKDFYTYMENFKQSFNDTVNSTVEAAVAPIRDKQSDIVKSVNNIEQKVASVEYDHEKTKTLGTFGFFLSHPLTKVVETLFLRGKWVHTLICKFSAKFDNV